MKKNEAEDAIYKKLKEIRDIMDEFTGTKDAVFYSRITESEDGGRLFIFDITEVKTDSEERTIKLDCYFAENKENNGKYEVCKTSFFDEKELKDE